MSNNIQVLVAAMHQTDTSLIQRMNLQTDALIGNQCDRCSDELYSFGNKHYVYFNRAERGVGLNRNITLLHAGDGIVTFADEDMKFVDGYESIIQSAFEQLPKADAIVFNIETIGNNMGRRVNQKSKRIRIWNALNYGAARISAKASVLRRENITFHTCFGGGTIYSSGEDTLFIVDMLKRGLKLYTYPACIASVDQTSSTWFTGYNAKYLHDKGAFFAAMSKRLAKLLCLQDLIRHSYLYKHANLTFIKAYKIMKSGINHFKTLKEYS